MTTRTDLTEHRDFSGGDETSNRWIPMSIDRIMVDNIIDSLAMSTDEYIKVLEYERMFGRKRHYTSVIEVFRKSNYEWMMEMHDHCQKCGKPFRTPWKKKYDLCLECDWDMEDRIPWKPEERARRRETTGDVLRLR